MYTLRDITELCTRLGMFLKHWLAVWRSLKCEEMMESEVGPADVELLQIADTMRETN